MKGLQQQAAASALEKPAVVVEKSGGFLPDIVSPESKKVNSPIIDNDILG